jgi:hypothetical protein
VFEKKGYDFSAIPQPYFDNDLSLSFGELSFIFNENRVVFERNDDKYHISFLDYHSISYNSFNKEVFIGSSNKRVFYE